MIDGDWWRLMMIDDDWWWLLIGLWWWLMMIDGDWCSWWSWWLLMVIDDDWWWLMMIDGDWWLVIGDWWWWWWWWWWDDGGDGDGDGDGDDGNLILSLDQFDLNDKNGHLKAPEMAGAIWYTICHNLPFGSCWLERRINPSTNITLQEEIIANDSIWMINIQQSNQNPENQVLYYSGTCGGSFPVRCIISCMFNLVLWVSL